MSFLGDFLGTETVYCLFCTVQATGAPTTLSGTPKLRVYKDNSTTESSDLTPTVDLDSRTGLNAVAIDLTGDSGFYAANHDYTIIISAGTVNSVSAVGYVVGQFSVKNRSLQQINGVSTSPVTTIKAVQGLAVDGVVTTVTNQLTAAQIATGIWQDTTAGDFTVAASVGKSIMNGVALGTGLTIVSVSGSVGSVTGLTAADVGAIKTKTDFLPSATAGAAGGVFIAGTNAATAITTALTANIVGNITGNLSGSVGSVTGLTASDVGAIKTKTDFLPSATAGAAGGVFIAGTNAATVVTTSFTTTFTGNLTGSVASVTAGVGLANGAITTAKIAVGAFDATVFSSDAEAAFADAFLDRDMSTGTDSGSTTVRTPRQALRVLRNKASIAGGTLTVTKENDVTASWTAAVTTTAGDPISAIDPAGP